MHSIHSNFQTLYCPLSEQKYHTLLDNIFWGFVDILEHIFNCYMVEVLRLAVKNRYLYIVKIAVFTPSLPSIFTDQWIPIFTSKSSDPLPPPYLYIVKIENFHPILTPSLVTTWFVEDPFDWQNIFPTICDINVSLVIMAPIWHRGYRAGSFKFFQPEALE